MLCSACRCDCAPGFDGVVCEIDVGPCSSNPCLNDARCIGNVETGYVCECAPGYEVNILLFRCCQVKVSLPFVKFYNTVTLSIEANLMHGLMRQSELFYNLYPTSILI